MNRICLLTPGHLSTNPRIVKEADALTDAGHDVTVIAADYSAWARDADRTIANRRWRVETPLHFGPHAPRRVRYVQLLRHHAARWATTSAIMSPAVVCAAWHPIAPDLVAAAKRVRAELYIAHYVAALPAAALAARYHRTRYAFDAEDFHLGDAPDVPRYDLQRRLTRAIEGRYLPDCAYVTAASPGIADAYAETYQIARPTVVLNVFPLTHAPACATVSGTADPGPSVYWFSQTIGADRGLECAIHAIGRARSRPHLYLRGTPALGFVDHLQNIASRANAMGRVHVLPLALPGEMERLASLYDVGLSGETGDTHNRRLALGNKLFSYLLAGLPIVASGIPAHLAFSRDVGNAMRLYPIDDADGLAAAFDDLLADPAKLAAARSAAYALGQHRFNWEFEQLGLCRQVQSAIDNMPTVFPGMPL